MRPLALVVENDNGIQRLLSVLLSRLGFDVDVLRDGASALVLLERVRYDLSLVDLYLPCRSGEEVLDWLAAHRPEDLTRAAIVTSATPATAHRLEERFSGLRVIRKPFELSDVISFAEAAKPPAERGDLTAAQQFARRSLIAGAKSGVIVRSGDLSLVHAFGYAPGVMERWFPLDAAAPFPLTRCIREEHPFWVASPRVAARDFPRLNPVWVESGSQALASVPLVRGGSVIGGVGWTFREPQLFDAAEQLAFTAIAEEAASLIEAA